MKKASIAFFAAAFVAGGAFAAAGTDTTDTDHLGVTTSTDPAKVAEVERHAQELQASQRGLNTSGTQAAQRSTKHHRRAKHHKPAATQDQGQSAPSSATTSKQ